MRQQIILLVVLSFLLGFTGCTSKKVDQENSDISELTGDSAAGDSAMMDEGSMDDFGSDVATTEGTEGGGLEELGASDDFSLDEPSADSMESTPDVAADSTESTGLDDFAGLDDSATSAPTEELATSDYAPEPTAPDLAAPSDDMAMSNSYDETQGFSEEPAAPKPMIPLQKMMTTPYRKKGVLVNGLYVARVGDTTESVARKIYGSDRSQELKDINSTLARRSMKVGDKVYYSSPTRPDDETAILTFYEEKGLAPEIYLSKPGDNIRVIAKDLLGHTNSWKELWATNLDVESKGELMEGTRLRYWSGDVGGAMPPVAASTDTGSSMDNMPPVDAMPPAEDMPPMPDDVAAAPPPAMDQDMMQESAPPPPMAEVAPPPPPPMQAAPPVAAASTQMDEGLGDDPDQLMTLMTGAILLIAAIAMFIIIRKKRAKRNSGIEFQTAANTQID
ncbi:MAG: hypothetical protein KDD38_09320 [Bdellovibrionales bacterium]|nr:hypothetical protein [Bdellovibrionales bacterium]